MNFFKHKTKFPKFKKKNHRQSFQVPQRGQIDFETGKLIIPKFLEGIRCHISKRFEGETKTFTVSKTTTGKYFVSVLVETPDEVPEKRPVTEETTIGIDVGIKDFCTLSTGEKVENPRHLKEELKRLKVLLHLPWFIFFIIFRTIGGKFLPYRRRKFFFQLTLASSVISKQVRFQFVQ